MSPAEGHGHCVICKQNSKPAMRVVHLAQVTVMDDTTSLSIPKSSHSWSSFCILQSPCVLRTYWKIKSQQRILTSRITEICKTCKPYHKLTAVVLRPGVCWWRGEVLRSQVWLGWNSGSPFYTDHAVAPQLVSVLSVLLLPSYSLPSSVP